MPNSFMNRTQIMIGLLEFLDPNWLIKLDCVNMSQANSTAKCYQTTGGTVQCTPSPTNINIIIL